MAIKKRPKLKPPLYLFVTNEDRVAWDDAMVAWVNLYHRLGNVGLDSKKPIQAVLKAVKEITGLPLAYWRWDADRKKYFRWLGPK